MTKMRKLLLIYIFIVMSHFLYAKGPRYRVMGIDSTEGQYVINLQNVSNYQIYTIYTYKISSETSEACIKKGKKKIAIGGIYRLKFAEYLPWKPEFRFDSKGNSVHRFYVDRLEGLYYDSSPVSIFRGRNYWKPKKNI